jgi:hypothetical protein
MTDATPEKPPVADGVEDLDAVRKRLAETEATLAKRDAAIKTMKQQAKDFLLKVEADYKARLAERDATIVQLKDQLATASSSKAPDTAASDALATLQATFDEHVKNAQGEAAALRLAVQERDAALAEKAAAHQAALKELEEQLSLAVAARATVEGGLAASQQQVAVLTRQVEGARKEAEAAARAGREAAAREATLTAQLGEATARAAAAEAATRAAVSEAAARRDKVADELRTRTSERDRLAADADRLTAEAAEAAAALRRAAADRDAAEASAAGARRALAVAEARAADAEARAGALSNTLRGFDTSGARARAEVAAAEAEAGRAKAEAEALRGQLAAVAARERDAHAGAAELAARVQQAEAVAADCRHRAEAAEARAAAAEGQAQLHQRKRLEAKTELVGVAAALEAERAASQKLVASLQGAFFDRFEAIGDGLRNLCATLDPSFEASGAADGDEGQGTGVDVVDIDLEEGGSGGGANAASTRAASAARRQQRGAALVAELSGKLRQSPSAAVASGAGPSVSASSGPPGPRPDLAATASALLAAMLDDAESCVFFATRAAVSYARAHAAAGGTGVGGLASTRGVGGSPGGGFHEARDGQDLCTRLMAALGVAPAQPRGLSSTASQQASIRRGRAARQREWMHHPPQPGASPPTSTDKKLHGGTGSRQKLAMGESDQETVSLTI